MIPTVARIVRKNTRFWRALAWLVSIVTFGKTSRQAFLEDYATTLGDIVGVPVDWNLDDPENEWVIGHEDEHIVQQKRLGLGNVWLGLVVWGFLYLFVPVPLFFAYFRWRFEREAYLVGFRLELAYLAGVLVEADWLARRAALVEFGTKQLTSWAYAKTWIFKSAVWRWFNLNLPFYAEVRSYVIVKGEA